MSNFEVIQGGTHGLTRPEAETVRMFASLLRNGTDTSRMAAIVATLGYAARERFGDDDIDALAWMRARMTDLGFEVD